MRTERSLEELNSRVETREERIRELEDKTIEMTKSENRERMDLGEGGRDEDSLRALWTLNRRANIPAVRVPGGEEKGCGAEKVFKIVAEKTAHLPESLQSVLTPTRKGKWERLRNLSEVTQLVVI